MAATPPPRGWSRERPDTDLTRVSCPLWSAHTRGRFDVPEGVPLPARERADDAQIDRGGRGAGAPIAGRNMSLLYLLPAPRDRSPMSRYSGRACFMHIFRPVDLSILVVSWALVVACIDVEPEAPLRTSEHALKSADSSTFYLVRGDDQICLLTDGGQSAPDCGGFWVERVNKKATTCFDGSKAAECYVADIDFGLLGLSDTEEPALSGSTPTRCSPSSTST